jgi:hypothetical protein
MGAPNGNQFWKARSKHGRNPIFASPDQLWDAAEEYFQWCVDNPLQEAIVYQGVLNEDQMKPLMRAMTLDGLLIFLDISDACWYDYKTKDGFSSVARKIDKIIRTQKFEGASAGLLNPNIIARDLGLSDRSELTGRDGGPIEHKATVITSEMDAETAARLYQQAINGLPES